MNSRDPLSYNKILISELGELKRIKESNKNDCASLLLEWFHQKSFTIKNEYNFDSTEYLENLFIQ